MRIKKQTGRVSKKSNKPVKLNIDLGTWDIMCRYVLSESRAVKVNNLANLRKLINVLDPVTYENDPEKKKRIDFIAKALEARLDYHLTDRLMIITHVNGGLTYDLDFIDVDNYKEINNNEVDWVHQLMTETLQYQFIYDKIDDIQDICTRFNASDYAHRGEIVSEFKDMVDGLKNEFRHVEADSSMNDITFSLRDGVFENAVTDTYNLVTNPNRRLICGMSGLNEMVGGGFESGRVYMLFGIGGVGKSLTLLNLLTQFKKYNRGYKCKDPTKRPCVVLLTMENTVVETITRLFSMSDYEGSGYMGDYNVEQVLYILRTQGGLSLTDDSPIDIVIKYKPNKSVDTSYLYTLTDDLEDDGYEVICLIQDHVKRIRSIYNDPDIRIELGDVVNEMKVYAADKDVPVISVSHLNRDAARITEDGVARGATADLTMKLGKSNVGESFLMVDNLDCGINIGLEFDPEGNRYLGFNLIKMRDKVSRTYIAQPFVYGSTIRLVEDVGSVPMFKESLHIMNIGTQNRGTTIVAKSYNIGSPVNNIDDIIGNDYDSENAFSNASAVDLNKIDEEPREIKDAIYLFDDIKPDFTGLSTIKDKIKQSRTN